jgi:hypothetical protein
MHTTFLLLSPPSILSEMNSKLRILWDFVFQLNSDFISNSNHNPSGHLPHPYISLGAPPPRIPMPISPQNQTLASSQVPPRHRCFSPLPPLFQSPPFKLNRVSIVRSQGPNHRRKNHIETRSVASAPYRRSLAIVSHRGCDFFDELKVNLTSPVSSPCRTLIRAVTFTVNSKLIRLYGSEIGGLYLKL